MSACLWDVCACVLCAYVWCVSGLCMCVVCVCARARGVCDVCASGVVCMCVSMSVCVHMECVCWSVCGVYIIFKYLFFHLYRLLPAYSFITTLQVTTLHDGDIAA